MPTWPGSVGFHLSRSLTMDRDSVNVSRIDMDVHTGTHLEAPLHFIEGGHDMDGFPLSLFIGPAQVISVPDALAIAAADLEHAGVSAGTERLLIRTRNSDGWQHQPFRDDYVALLPDAATWIVQHRIRLLGIDYLSVQRYGDDPETHRILMRGGVAILEGLDLGLAKPGTYRLHALPIYLANSEAAPVRAVLEPLP
ncbi:MAG TPA: cyclase family protein [Candidatus Limnocylindria bacterium]|nr:cyclase family protein [Candidatus Limnocylindria bacterium]